MRWEGFATVPSFFYPGIVVIILLLKNKLCSHVYVCVYIYISIFLVPFFNLSMNSSFYLETLLLSLD